MSDNNTKQGSAIGQALDVMTGDDEKAKLALLKQLNSMLEKAAGTDKPKKPVKQQPKVVRDSFTLPEDDYQLMLDFQTRGIRLEGRNITKGEILRAGLHALQNLDDETFLAMLDSVEKLKPGRRKDD